MAVPSFSPTDGELASRVCVLTIAVILFNHPTASSQFLSSFPNADDVDQLLCAKATFASSLEKHPHNPLLSFVLVFFLTYFYSFLVWVHSDGVHASEYKEARGDIPRAGVTGSRWKGGWEPAREFTSRVVDIPNHEQLFQCPSPIS